MTVFLCLDANNGMRFNGRRQSRDRGQRADMLRLAGARRIYMRGEAAKLFLSLPVNVVPTEDFSRVPAEACAFVERAEDLSCLRPEEVVIYRWGCCYPADEFLPCAYLAGYVLVDRTEITGSSHEKISVEVYRCDG
ncbi:MAG: hypothetical protein IKL89_07205 [Clostridia bacterium]|nr:hypothetical protein [Clostridia bacterium]